MSSTAWWASSGTNRAVRQTSSRRSAHTRYVYWPRAVSVGRGAVSGQTARVGRRGAIRSKHFLEQLPAAILRKERLDEGGIEGELTADEAGRPAVAIIGEAVRIGGILGVQLLLQMP